MFKAVVFDFNGVIVDDYPIQKDAWNKFSQRLRGKQVTDGEMLHNIRGVPTKDIILWMTHNSIRPEVLDKLVKEKANMVKKMYLESPLFRLNKGLAGFLDELKSKNIPLTIASSSTFNDIRFSFDRLGLGRWFDLDLIVFNDGSYKGKPAPDPYIRAASKLKRSPSECVIFEDAASGVTSAYSAGSRSIIAVGSDERLSTLRQMPGVVLGIHDFTEIDLNLLSQLRLK